GSAPRDIAEPRTSYRGAVWSPDGLRVTYFARGLYFVVPADGSEPARELGRVPSGDLLEIEWPPGAEEPTLRNRSGEDPIEIDAETGEYKRTTDAGFVVDDVAMAWSPDGSRVAYLGWASNREVGTSCGFAEVGLIDPDTLTMTPIRPRPAGAYDELCNAHGLRWAPDGRHLVFSASRVASYGNSGPHSLYRLDLADGAVTRITDRSETDDFVVDWLPVPDLLGRACPSGSTPSAGFPDTAGSSHARGIDCAVAWEIAAGRTDGTYGPGVPVTRAQMASFVARALEGVGVELPEITGSRFDDVDATSTHGQRIEQLAELGLVDGVTPGRYAPGRSVTRAQMAKFLVGAYEQAAEQSLPMWPDAFVDDDGVALESWVNAASSVGLTGGVESSRYAPGGVVDRGQMATFLSRLVDRLARDLDLPAR
ncbi:MAG TPA: S-layer homology domain-containing protein, partial [Egicoccus sp.]